MPSNMWHGNSVFFSSASAANRLYGIPPGGVLWWHMHRGHNVLSNGRNHTLSNNASKFFSYQQFELIIIYIILTRSRHYSTLKILD